MLLYYYILTSLFSYPHLLTSSCSCVLASSCSCVLASSPPRLLVFSSPHILRSLCSHLLASSGPCVLTVLSCALPIPGGFKWNPLESTGISKEVFSFCFSLVYSSVVQSIPVHSSPFQFITVQSSPFQFILVLFFYIINCSKLPS